jgi:hypothetical protein
VNATKIPAKEDDGKAGDSEGFAWTGNYNRRTVCAELYKDDLKTIIDKRTAGKPSAREGPDRLAAYQEALTILWNRLSPEKQKECSDTATKWNKAKSPPEMQRK